MTDVLAAQGTSGRLRELAERLAEHDDFDRAAAALASAGRASFDQVWGPVHALLAAALLRRVTGPLVIVLPQPGELDSFSDEVSQLSGIAVEQFPAWETGRGETLLTDDLYGQRLRVVKSLAKYPLPSGEGRVRGTSSADKPSPQPSPRGRGRSSGTSSEPIAADRPPRVLITSIQALLQPVPDRQRIAALNRVLSVGQRFEVNGLLTWLVENGFHRTSAVELPGEFSSRGGIVDVFAPDAEQPVRIEFFGDEIESIRQFDVATQRSSGDLSAIDITVLTPSTDDRECLLNLLPDDSWLLLVEPSELSTEGNRYIERAERAEGLWSTAAVLRAAERFPLALAEALTASPLPTHCRLPVESVERFSGDVVRLREELEKAAETDDVLLVCRTEAEVKRLREVLAGVGGKHSTPHAPREENHHAERDGYYKGRLQFVVGHLRGGFRMRGERLLVISGDELFHRTELPRPARRRLGKVIDSFTELREGDLVVHLAHGIGRYRGLALLEKDGASEEHLGIEFDGGTKIYVPATRIGLIQKYVGGTKSRPRLAKIGGKSWVKQKQAAEKAVVDLAVDMLELQAARAARPGIPFPADSEWQQEFDASFPYQETDDQLTALSAIKLDMQRPRPMDRLLCGDVGYGKTELAIRAAFKAVDNGYQVAVLVPTTILAEQHLRTFQSRMAEFPFHIAALSRFSSHKEQNKTIEQLAKGTVDIVIGTHRLASADVHFANLGLVIIDEEQRFGVEVKERLKRLRHTVDVLTMTATPIPRTLHLSLVGARDISNLETPPEERMAVETRVTRFDPELVRHAVLRELGRQGQVFFVHNRVEDIQLVAARLQKIVPEATLGIGHGQMPEHQLEQVMLDFVAHRFDMLVATTIVESGLDIPNANTIFIDEADRYGLADLHQLRGRVGRYKHRAYCYLLLDPRRHVSPNASRRLRAIEEFSQMGAGFAIAMRDLEIRGAGNILGTQQSGHIAAIGYELYCELLENAVRRLKREPVQGRPDVDIALPGEAHLPRSYVGDMRLKLDLYRRLGRVTNDAELGELVAEMTDRFGVLPPPAARLVELTRLRIDAGLWAVDSIHIEDTYVVLGYQDRSRIEQLARASHGRLRVVDDRSAYLPVGADVKDPEIVLSAAKSLLRPA